MFVGEMNFGILLLHLLLWCRSEHVRYTDLVCLGQLGEIGLPGVRGGGFVKEDSSGTDGDVSHQRESGAAQRWKLL